MKCRKESVRRQGRAGRTMVSSSARRQEGRSGEPQSPLPRPPRSRRAPPHPLPRPTALHRHSPPGARRRPRRDQGTPRPRPHRRHRRRLRPRTTPPPTPSDRCFGPRPRPHRRRPRRSARRSRRPLTLPSALPSNTREAPPECIRRGLFTWRDGDLEIKPRYFGCEYYSPSRILSGSHCEDCRGLYWPPACATERDTFTCPGSHRLPHHRGKRSRNRSDPPWRSNQGVGARSEADLLPLQMHPDPYRPHTTGAFRSA